MPDQVSRALSMLLQRLARERGLSARALALASGLNPRSAERKIAGTSTVDVDDVVAFAQALEVTPEELLTWARREV